MTDTRRGHRDDSIYFDHRVGTDCLDGRLHKCPVPSNLSQASWI